MKKIIYLLVICSVVSSLFAAEFDLKTRTGAPFTSAGQKIEPVQKDGKAALLFSWDASKKRWAEFGWIGTKALPFFRTLTVKVSVAAGEKSTPKIIDLRLVDREGEVFQFPATARFDELGRATLTYTILHDGKVGGSWLSGKNAKKNGKIDQPVRLYGLAFDYPSDSGEGEIFITKIEEKTTPLTGEAVRNIPPPFEFHLVTGHPVRLVSTYCYAEIFNPTDAEHAFQVKFTVRDAGGNIIGRPTERKDSIGRRSRRFFALPIPKKFGLYRVEAEITSNAIPNGQMNVTRSFAFFKPATLDLPYQEGNFRFGVQTHWKQDPTTWTTEADACRTAGISFIRDEVGIGSIWPGKNTWRYGLKTLPMDVFLSRGIKTVLLINGSAPWANQNPQDPQLKQRPWAGMPRLDLWRTFCAEVFQKFGGKVDHFEIWNEPDLMTFAVFSPEEYHQLAEIAREEIKKHAPHAKLMSAGFCNFNEKGQFQERAMTLCKDLFDIHCFHGHGPQSGFASIIDRKLLPMRERIGIAGTMPWYAHETALTSTGFGESAQAEALFQKLLFAWSRGSIGYTWYDLRNDGFDPGNPEHNYGMLTNDYYPKEVYVVYNTLTTLFGGDTKFLRTLVDDRQMSVLLFGRERDLLLPVWLKTPHQRAKELHLKTDANQVERIDLAGNITALAKKGDLVRCPISKTPFTIRLRNASQIAIRPNGLSAVSSPVLLASSTPSIVEFFAFNPDEKQQTMTLTAFAPEGIRAELPAKLTLAPQERKNFKAILHGSSESPKTVRQTLRVAYSLTNGEKDECSVLLLPLFLPEREFTAKPYAQLNRRDQLVELFDADPGNVFRLRKNDDDLSAKIFLADNGTDLNIKVVVTDDEHRPSNRADSIWKGDSLQLLFAFDSGKKVLEIGCALGEDGKQLQHCWSGSATFRSNVTRSGKTTTYLVSIPWPQLHGTANERFSFNALVNESDSDRRESFLRLAPGAGDGTDSTVWPVIGQSKRADR
ncbi:MAG: hypothetical protein PHS41_01345 [Victivallaceae bacterium]|nr:hypothetical protein [Victivallaceae bacterium]